MLSATGGERMTGASVSEQPIHTVVEVMTALQELRISKIVDEYTLQQKLKEQLDAIGIAYQKEYRLGPRCRLDFLVAGGIAIEVKRGRAKPNRSQVAAQLARYATFEEVRAIVLVVDRNVHVPAQVNGKPCFAFGLHKLWGIAL